MVNAARLHRARTRKETGLTLVEGPHIIADAIAAGVIVRELFALVDDASAVSLAESSGTDVVWVDERGLAKVAGTEHPRGPIALIEIPEPTASAGSCAVLWELSDPGNAGTIVRTAAAFGYGVVAVGGVDVWAPKVIRAGAGGHFATPLERVPSLDLDRFRSMGLTTVATVAEGGVGPGEVPDGPVAVLVGNEAHGLPADVVAGADFRMTIPMPGTVESLNAAAATAVALYALGDRE